MQSVIFVGIGLIAGICGGMFGLGGGSVMIPALVFLAGFTQHQAQGTTLAALVPPIGLLAAWEYWRHGNVNIPVAGLICAGFLIGGFAGAHLVQGMPSPVLKKLFGVFLLVISAQMIFSK
jgi:uncharacterized protein